MPERKKKVTKPSRPSKPKPEPKVKSGVQCQCEEAMELVGTRAYLRLRIKACKFILTCEQPPPWGYVLEGGLNKPELTTLLNRIKETPERG